VISPLLANIYLHGFDQQMQAAGIGELVRYADLCRTLDKSAYAVCRVMPHGPRRRCGQWGSGLVRAA
jgi:retron-type reverse transcriptase